MIEVFIERENKTKQVKENNLKAVLDTLKINPETVLIVKNDELVTINTKINPKDKIKLLSVVSGG
ncbi:MAG: MoaD/ThiS family protein [archaeon]